jgi:hypothetical protein
MRLTHLLALLVAAPSSYVLYDKLAHPPADNEPPASEESAFATSQPSAASAGLRQLKPTDWVGGLPEQGRARYVEWRISLRGSERVDAARAWMALWSKYLRDPNLALVELDYIDLNIKNRSPLLYTIVKRSNNTEMVLVRYPAFRETGEWKREYQQRLSMLDSMDYMLRAMRVRGINHPGLLEMMGETTDKIIEERNKLMPFKTMSNDGSFR